MSPSKTTVVCALLFSLAPISIGMYTPAMAAIAQHYAVGDDAVRSSLLVFFVAFAASQLLLVPLSDSLGRKTLILPCLFLFLTASILAAVASSVEVLLAARAGQGVGAGVCVTVARAVVRDLYVGETSVRIFNATGIVLSAGNLFTPIIGSLLLFAFGWKSIFWFMALYGALALWIWTTAAKETLKTWSPTPGPAEQLRRYKTLLCDRSFVLPCLIVSISMGTSFAFAGILPFILIGALGMSPEEFAVGLLAQSASYVTGSVAARKLMGRLRVEVVVKIGLGLMTAGAAASGVLLTLSPLHYATVMGPLILFMFGLAFINPGVTTAMLASNPALSGIASSLTGVGQMLMGFLGVIIANVSHSPELPLPVVMLTAASISSLTFILGRGHIQLP
jgi:DHA1 family bicyclomycin/chloramphenicol resistance-like MFS transporter